MSSFVTKNKTFIFILDSKAFCDIAYNAVTLFILQSVLSFLWRLQGNECNGATLLTMAFMANV